MKFMAAFVKRNDARLHITVLISFKMKADIKSKEKNLSVLKRAMSKKSAGWSSRDWNSKGNWQRSAVEDGEQNSQDKWKSSKLRVKWKEISSYVEQLGILLKSKNSTRNKSCKESSKKAEAHAISEGMTQDAKVYDGVRLRRALKQLQRQER